jgi:hypothetical protein
MFNPTPIVAVLALLAAPALSLGAADSASTAAAPMSQEKGNKKRMGVPGFTNTTKYTGIDDRLADLLVSELMANRNYELIERTQLAKLMQEQGLGQTGILDQSNAAQIGKIGALDYIVLGSLTQASVVDREGEIGFGANKGQKTYSAEVKVGINLKVIEVETGKIVLSDDAWNNKIFTKDSRYATVSAENVMEVAKKAITGVAFKVLREIAPLEPSILKVDAKGIIIDMGREDGIKEGQRFEIVREGEPLLDRNGAVIGVEKIEIGYVTVSSVDAATAKAKVEKIHKDPSTKKPYEIKRGDLLRPQDRTKSRGFGEMLNDSLKGD